MNMEGHPRIPQQKPLTPEEIIFKVKEKTDMLLVPEDGEALKSESYALIARRIANQAQEPLTQETLDTVLESPEVQDEIIKTTIARLEADTHRAGAYVYDSNGHVIKRIENRAQMSDTTREQREST